MTNRRHPQFPTLWFRPEREPETGKRVFDYCPMKSERDYVWPWRWPGRSERRGGYFLEPSGQVLLVEAEHGLIPEPWWADSFFTALFMPDPFFTLYGKDRYYFTLRDEHVLSLNEAKQLTSKIVMAHDGEPQSGERYHEDFAKEIDDAKNIEELIEFTSYVLMSDWYNYCFDEIEERKSSGQVG